MKGNNDLILNESTLIEATRERCAEVADEQVAYGGNMASYIAAAIRKIEVE